MADRYVLLVRHVADETGGLAVAPLRGLPTRWASFPTSVPPVDELAGVVAFGGAMAATDVAAYPSVGVTIDLLRRATDAAVPVLGLCLGHQMLGVALGGRAHPGSVHEVGRTAVRVVAPDPFLGGFTGELRPVQWHRDTVDLPPGATALAENATCANQAFRCGSAVGLQFHLEVDDHVLARWLTEEGMAADLPPDVTPAALTAGFRADDRLRAVATAGFAAFADACRARLG